MPKANWGGGASGALSGAASGAMIGSVVPGVGTAIGAVAGGLFGGLGGLFGGGNKKRKKLKKLSTLDPQQQALYNDYISSIRGEGPMAGMYKFDEEGYNKVFDQTIGRHAYRNFNENVIPGITGQFRGGNIGNSSYTGESLSRAGRDVQENLDALRSQNIFQGQQQALDRKQSAIQGALNTQTFAYHDPNSGAISGGGGGGIDSILNSVAPAAGEWFADYLKQGVNKAASPAAPAASPVT